MTGQELISREEALAAFKEILREEMKHSISLPREEAAEIAKVTALTTVHEHNTKLFALLGYDLADMDDVKKLRDDLSFSGTLRTGSYNIAGAIIKAVAVAIVLVFLAWMAVGARDALHSHPTQAPFP